MFRRRARADDAATDDELQPLDDAWSEDEDDEPDHEQDRVPAVAGSSRPAGPTAGTTAGPWDADDVPAADETPRVDLGGIAVPVPEGLEVRVEVQDDVVVAATLVDGSTLLQIHAFAAPRSAGLWDEVREEIMASLQRDSGSAEQVDGPFGPELRARVPGEGGLSPARFLGVDGPRWFLRGLMTGPGSTDPAQGRRLEAAFRDVVVHRGGEAMAPRDMLPLRLPREAMEDPHDPHDPEEPSDEPQPPRELLLPERGPEITEIQ